MCTYLAKRGSTYYFRSVIPAELRATLGAKRSSWNPSDQGSRASQTATLNVLQGINVQLERYTRLHLRITHGTDEAKREHREILRLCASRDADGAVAFLRAHILNTATNLAKPFGNRRK